ncbi:hypothetical protein CBR_g38644 [Chara braunii]|uniref:Uncharacterized protein n=1 Tax=Chara braunii TaxID=69332 RepID=A0A388K0L2_CHABU|nr:hypothetical protein CBR_g38644 [Chara braunii]|eukprot:GBG63578.1 hypothetical protein CBR_g38644 [Chara braunii]
MREDKEAEVESNAAAQEREGEIGDGLSKGKGEMGFMGDGVSKRKGDCEMGLMGEGETEREGEMGDGVSKRESEIMGDGLIEREGKLGDGLSGGAGRESNLRQSDGKESARNYSAASLIRREASSCTPVKRTLGEMNKGPDPEQEPKMRRKRASTARTRGRKRGCPQSGHGVKVGRRRMLLPSAAHDEDKLCSLSSDGREDDTQPPPCTVNGEGEYGNRGELTSTSKKPSPPPPASPGMCKTYCGDIICDYTVVGSRGDNSDSSGDNHRNNNNVNSNCNNSNRINHKHGSGTITNNSGNTNGSDGVGSGEDDNISSSDNKNNNSNNKDEDNNR